MLRSESASDAHLLAVHSVQARGQHLGAVHRARLRFQRAGGGLRQLLLQLLDLLCERALIGQQLLDVLDQLRLGGANHFGDAAQGARGFLDIGAARLRR